MGKARVTTDKRTGNLVVRAYAGRDKLTKKVYAPSKTLPADASEEEIEQAKAWVEMRAGSTMSTVGDLVDYYLAGLLDFGYSPTTVAAYRSSARCYVRPKIGKLQFADVRQSDFDSLYRELLRKGSKKGGPLSAQTVRKLHAFLSGCFSALTTAGVTDRNPLSGLKAPKGSSPEAKPLSERDFAILVKWLRDALSAPVEDDKGWDRRVLAAALWTDLHTGARRAEISGWRAEDYRPPGAPREDDPATLRVATVLVEKKGCGLVRKPPKSKAGKRILSIDDETDRVVREHMDLQAAVLADHGVRMSGATPLFAHADGRPLEPRMLTDRFTALRKSLGMESHVHLHTLRHTHASYLLEAGEHIKTIQERLGHSTSKMTLDIYGHLMPGRDATAAKTFGRVSMDIAQQAHNDVAPLYVPKCPLSGATCVRFSKGAGTGNA